MALDFVSVVSAPPSGRSTAVIIDHQQYARTVLLRGQPVPWGDAMAYSNFFGQAQALLKPDATLLDLGALYDFLLASDDALKTSMSARSRTGYALKTLLADEGLAGKALEFASVLSQTSSSPLVLQIPSPMLWLARTHELSGAGALDDLEADHAENMAMYVADWLRRLSALPVSLLLLDARWAGPGRLPAVDLTAYTPISNITDHYRWTLGQRDDDGVRVAGRSVTGVAVPPDYWRSEGATAPVGDFLIADIPADAVPETVLAQLAHLT
ncbi:hypothetical protein ABZV31_22615 [Streptomyces sp. NPDC005202]|uniref:hypothetical protein n=1 Tax=Streptomyces sp. NPDC005202 TaxID=3157021 RepID=UPI0033ABE571